MLAQSGTSFDPILLKVFINMLGAFPVGTLLKLDTGEMGLWRYDPYTGTFAENLWTNTLGGAGSFGFAVALTPSGTVLVAGRSSRASGAVAALWAFTGGSFSAPLVSTGVYRDTAFALALDDDGNAWLSGSTQVDGSGSLDLAVWEIPAGYSALNSSGRYRSCGRAALSIHGPPDPA